MKIILILLLFTQALIASTFREESLDLGSGQVLTMINLKDGFWVGKYEVTQGQWMAVMGKPKDVALKCLINDPKLRGDNRPMDTMGLDLALSFCETISAKTGRKIRLPTETEWEFFANGTSPKDAVSSVGMDKRGLQGPADVGTKGPNRFGLYDTLGNVMEICSGDWNAHKGSKKGKPMLMAGNSGPWVPCRGGCYWMNGPTMIKVEFRDYAISQTEKYVGGVGFRVVMDK